MLFRSRSWLAASWLRMKQDELAIAARKRILRLCQ